MSKGTEATGEGSENLPEESGRSYGLLAILAVLTIVGIVVWFIANQGDTD